RDRSTGPPTCASGLRRATPARGQSARGRRASAALEAEQDGAEPVALGRHRRLDEPAECDGGRQDAVDLAQRAEPVPVELRAITAGAAAAFADVLHDAGERVFELATQPRAPAAKQVDGGAQTADQIEGEIESEKGHERSPVGGFAAPSGSAVTRAGMRRWRSPPVVARVARAVPRQGEEPPTGRSSCPPLAISLVIRGLRTIELAAARGRLSSDERGRCVQNRTAAVDSPWWRVR